MKEPKLGNQLLFRPKDSSASVDTRHIATVAHVHFDGTVNIGTLTEHGVPENAQNVRIVESNPACGEAVWPEAGGLLGAVDSFPELADLIPTEMIQECNNDEVVTGDDLIDFPDGTDEATDDLSAEDDEYPGENESEEESMEEVELSVDDDLLEIPKKLAENDAMNLINVTADVIVAGNKEEK